MAEGESRNKTSYVLAYMQNCKLRVGDKLATQHGQKFTISQILDDNEMPTCYDEQTGASLQTSYHSRVVICAQSWHLGTNIRQCRDAHVVNIPLRNHPLTTHPVFESTHGIIPPVLSPVHNRPIHQLTRHKARNSSPYDTNIPQRKVRSRCTCSQHNPP